MNFLNQLTKSISSTNILALDPSINNTGYCWIECLDKSIYIKRTGLISSTKESEEDKINQIINTLLDSLKYISSARFVIVIEKPPSTLYNQKFSKDMIVARATKLFKLFMLYGALYQSLTGKGFTVISIPPIEWQRKVKRRGLDIKLLSVGLANSRILEQQKNAQPTNGNWWPTLESNDDNVADAVNIAFHTWLHREKLLRNILPKLVS